MSADASSMRYKRAIHNVVKYIDDVENDKSDPILVDPDEMVYVAAVAIGLFMAAVAELAPHLGMSMEDCKQVYIDAALADES
jgi:hypothetical protein